MNQLFYRISGIIGILIFLSHLWDNGSIENAFLSSTVTALLVYCVFLVGYLGLHQVLQATPPEEEAKPEREKGDNVAIQAEPQAA